MVSQTLKPSQVMVQIVGASPASGVPGDPAGESVHCHSAPYSSSVEGVFPQEIKWLIFYLKGFKGCPFT